MSMALEDQTARKSMMGKRGPGRGEGWEGTYIRGED